MSKKHAPYAPEFRRQMVAMARAGRTPVDLAKEFEPSAQAIRNWVAQADRDEGRREDGVTSAEREELARLRREAKQLKLEREVLSKAAARVSLGRRTRSRRRVRIREREPGRPPRCSSDRGKQRIPCRYDAPLGSGVSPSGFYAWARRQPSERARDDARLAEEIRAAHAGSKGAYGAPRIQVELAERGIRASRKRIARLMSAQGLAGVSRRRGVRTTVRDGARQRLTSLIATSPERTFIVSDKRSLSGAKPAMGGRCHDTPTWAGFLCLAAALDVFSRRIVGWAMAATLKTELVLDALDMALWRRRPQGVIHHSDQGSQYASIGFGNRCREAGARPSMGSVGDCFDNAIVVRVSSPR